MASVNKANGKDERSVHLGQLIEIPLKAAGVLRDKLGWSEDSYHYTYPPTTTNPKGYYLYGVLNEIEKACMSIMQANEFVSDSRKVDEPADVDDDAKRIKNNILLSRVDELALWQRKLTEYMVELQGFASANKTNYYKHFLIINELQSLHRTIDDLTEFYDVDNSNYRYQEQDLITQIDALTPKLDASKIWYVKVKSDRITHTPTQFNERFEWSFKRMNVYHRATLRTRNLSFGSQSKHIHASSSASDYHQLTLNSIEAHAARVATLAMHVIVMMKDLMHIQNTKGVLKLCSDVIKKNDYPVQLHNRRTRLDIQAGDFVVANGHLAEVVKVIISKGYRFRSFKVRYLLEAPLPNIHEEEMPGDWVRLLYKREPLVVRTIAAFNQINSNKKPSTRWLNKALKDGVVEGWNNGLKEYALGIPEKGEPKLKVYEKLMQKRYDMATTRARLQQAPPQK